MANVGVKNGDATFENVTSNSDVSCSTLHVDVSANVGDLLIATNSIAPTVADSDLFLNGNGIGTVDTDSTLSTRDIIIKYGSALKGTNGGAVDVSLMKITAAGNVQIDTYPTVVNTGTEAALAMPGLLLKRALTVAPSTDNGIYLEFQAVSTGGPTQAARISGRSENVANARSYLEFSVNNGSGLQSCAKFDSNGILRLTKHPAFVSRLETSAANATGNGAEYTYSGCVEYDDATNSFNPTTGLFTAPVDGYYLFDASLIYNNVTSAATQVYLYLYIGTTNYSVNQCNAANFRDTSNNMIISGTKLVKMSAGQSIGIKTRITGMAGNTVSIGSSTASYYSSFSGRLLG